MNFFNEQNMGGKFKKTKTKSVYRLEGSDEDEIVDRPREAPRKGKGKRKARVGEVVRDAVPVKDTRGMSASERRVKQMMEEAVEGKREKKKQKKDNDVDDGGASLLRREVKGLEHLKKLAHASDVMDERSYKRALGVALRKGLEEQQKEVGVVMKKKTRKAEKNRERMKMKREKEKEKKKALKMKREEEKMDVSRVEYVPFGERVDAPPDDLEMFKAKLEQMGRKIRSKQQQQQQQMQ